MRETTDIDKTVLGEALAYSEERNPFLAKLRFHFIRTFSFTDMPLDMVLRSFLGTFRIPGEAQAIDRIMDDLSVVVYEFLPIFDIDMKQIQDRFCLQEPYSHCYFHVFY